MSDHAAAASSDRLAALRLIALGLAFCLTACSEPTGPLISKTPVSIRGWLTAPAGGDPSVLHLTDTASTVDAHRARVFEQTALSVEGFPFASGGMAGNGSFIILDVPPGDVTINFQPPEGIDGQLFMKGVPANADVLLQALEFRGSEVVPIDPAKVVVRVGSNIESRRPMPGANMTVAGQPVQVVEVPLRELIDRREFPEP